MAPIMTVLKNIGTLTLLLIAFPFNLVVVLAAWLWSRLTQPFTPKPVANNPKTILLTGGKMTKALQLARLFHATGHRVIVVEIHKYWLSGHRFSNAIARFYTVPAPEKDPEGYYQSLGDIIRSEGVDVFIPVSSPVASYYDAVAATHFPPECEVLHFTSEMTQLLDDKFRLCQTARELGLSAPKSFLITDVEQILNFDFEADGSRYILKSLKYDSVLRLDLTLLPFPGMAEYIKRLPISAARPWTMQEFITGQEYCTHSTVRHGKVQLHCCSKSSPFQVNYEHVDRPEILAWVQRFAAALNLTGQLSFDFIQTEEGTVYPIECNPRTHSAITMFHDRPELAAAYLEDRAELLEPLPQSKPTYWLYHEIWRLMSVRSIADLRTRWQILWRGTDAIFQRNDPLPFLWVHHWQIPLLLLDNLRKLRGWVRIDFNIGKLVELGGD